MHERQKRESELGFRQENERKRIF